MIKTLVTASPPLRPSPKPFLIIIALSLLCLAGTDARAGSTSDTALREKDIKRGERILATLRALDQSQPEAAYGQKQRRPARKISDELFVEAASLRPGDLKTDLTTALFLYDEAFHEEFNSRRAFVDCENELKEAYARICRENQGGTLSLYLQVKARLHARFAEATINNYRGIKDGATNSVLEEMRRERLNDVRLAERAVKALKSLEGEVYDYKSLADFEEHRRLSSVPFERFAEDVSEMLRRVDPVLLSLPRSPLFYPLYHARNLYADGLFRWRKTYRQTKMVVNADSFNKPDEMKSRDLVPEVSNYAVAINWRKAINHTREAARLIEALKP
ncbi:MAG TPA: hypothetical protein VM095_17810 [Pyrinomonadaceae bacterium]|nr:hypothetical protein [Pyrinomonadaceae bacterium]